MSADIRLGGRLRIINAAGMTMMEKACELSPEPLTIQWEAHQAPPGVYFVRFESESGSVVRRVVKM
jgi:hypothetical protein